MNFKIYSAILSIALLAFHVKAEDIKTERTLFEDRFDSPEIKKDWTIESGKWEIKNGTLLNQNGGIISVKKPFENFVLEADVRTAEWTAKYPWVSVAFSYEDKNNNSFLTLTPAESHYYIYTVENGKNFTKTGRKIPFDQKKFHKVKIACSYNVVSFFWDDAFMFSGNADCSGSRIAFIGNGDGVDFEIKNLRIMEIMETPGKTVEELKASDLANAEIWNDYQFKCAPEKENKPIIEGAIVFLPYDFTDDKEFRGTFLSLPVNIKKAGKICLTFHGDASMNKFFIIVHDKSGEQHLLYNGVVRKDGPHDTKVDMADFLKSPPPYFIEATHWNGDKNQKIDLPITKLDIGICRSGKAEKQKGRIGISNLRFEE